MVNNTNKRKGNKNCKKRKRKKVSNMPVAARNDLLSERERKLAEARKLSEKITSATKAAGITQEELENNAYKCFLDDSEEHSDNC